MFEHAHLSRGVFKVRRSAVDATTAMAGATESFSLWSNVLTSVPSLKHGDIDRIAKDVTKATGSATTRGYQFFWSIYISNEFRLLREELRTASTHRRLAWEKKTRTLRERCG